MTDLAENIALKIPPQVCNTCQQTLHKKYKNIIPAKNPNKEGFYLLFVLMSV